jgi:pimeloyl-ACP methyl ester carboxylesterase
MQTKLHQTHSATRRAAALTAGLVVLAASTLFWTPTMSKAASPDGKPTVVLVHGAFAESQSWDGVVTQLLAKGYPVVAVANPLRGVRSDAAYVANVVDSIPGPVVLVGHSYGGNVITNAATGKANVKALVYVAGFAPDTGETAAGLSGKFPGSTLGPTLAPPVALADGNKDLYIQQAKFRAQFAADVPAKQAAVMAATQRPITEAALNEPSGTPAWKDIPSWFIWGSLDKNIPPAAQQFVAQRAGARRIVEVAGASHVVMTSRPGLVTKIILEAATAVEQ